MGNPLDRRLEDAVADAIASDLIASEPLSTAFGRASRSRRKSSAKGRQPRRTAIFSSRSSGRS
jgi:hypothetical protein